MVRRLSPFLDREGEALKGSRNYFRIADHSELFQRAEDGRHVFPWQTNCFFHYHVLIGSSRVTVGPATDSLSSTHSGLTFISHRADRAIAEPSITATSRTPARNVQTRP